MEGILEVKPFAYQIYFQPYGSLQPSLEETGRNMKACADRIKKMIVALNT